MNNLNLIKYTTASILMGALTGMNSVYASDDEIDTEVDTEAVTIEMFAPAKNDRVGINGNGWFVDLAVIYPSLETSGFTNFQLTGPGPHNNVAPFPGTFSPGADEHIPGLIVLLKTTTIGAQSCQNLANLFNLTGVTNIQKDLAELWDTWIVGAPLFGQGKTKIYVAIAADVNKDGIYNDAPNIIPDADGNGKCNKKDIEAFGVASNIVKEKFFIN